MRVCGTCGLQQNHPHRFCKQCGADLPLPAETRSEEGPGGKRHPEAGAAGVAEVAAGRMAPPVESAPQPPPQEQTASGPPPGGEAVTPTVACRRCGAGLPADWNFCESCGQSQQAGATPARRGMLAAISVAGVAILGLCAAVYWYFFSFHLTLGSIAPGSTVSIDGEVVTDGKAGDGAVKVGPLARKMHLVRVESPKHIPWVRSYWAEPGSFSERLEVRQLPEVGCVTFRASGWVEVSMGTDAGGREFCAPVGTEATAKSASDGREVKFTYQHDDQFISLTREEGVQQPQTAVAPPSETALVGNPDPARARQLVREAEALFAAAKYREALQLCDSASKANPGDTAARALATRITKTMQILGAK